MIPFPLFVQAFFLFLSLLLVYRALSAMLFLYLGVILLAGFIMAEMAGVWSAFSEIQRTIGIVQGVPF